MTLAALSESLARLRRQVNSIEVNHTEARDALERRVETLEAENAMLIRLVKELGGGIIAPAKPKCPPGRCVFGYGPICVRCKHS